MASRLIGNSSSGSNASIFQMIQFVMLVTALIIGSVALSKTSTGGDSMPSNCINSPNLQTMICALDTGGVKVYGDINVVNGTYLIDGQPLSNSSISGISIIIGATTTVNQPPVASGGPIGILTWHTVNNGVFNDPPTNTEFTVQETGFYLLNAQLILDWLVNFDIYINNVLLSSTSSGFNVALKISTFLDFVAGDVIRFETSGSEARSQFFAGSTFEVVGPF